MPRRSRSKRKVLLALTITQQAYYRGIVRYAREHDWHLVTDMTYTGRVPRGWQGDGILTIPGYRSELVDFLRTSRVPVVGITLVNASLRLPRVEGDNDRIGALAADHFLARGYRHFAWAPFMDDVMNTERMAGFARTLVRHGFACRTLPLAHTVERRGRPDNWAARRQRLVSELRALPRPAAVFAYNDCLASDVIDACRDAGLRVPEEIAVLGVDDDATVCDCAPVPLSSVRHDLEGMAYAAAGLLERLMRGRSAPARVIRIAPLGVVTRASTDMLAVGDVRVAIALRCLAERFADPQLTVDAVVAAARISRRQLERLFRQATGTSLHERLTEIRLAEVRRRLVETPASVTDIARATGFGRLAGLFRAFRARFRTTPRRYRTSRLGRPAVSPR